MADALVVSIVVFTLFVLVSVLHSTPFIVLHGINDECSKVAGFTSRLGNLSGSPGYCIEVGNGQWDSWFMPLVEQSRVVCEKVKQMPELSQGYNMVGLSQGNLIGRGVIEFCDGGPPVKNYVSLAGPHAGTASVPLCGSEALCTIAAGLIKSEIYTEFIQDHLAPSGYLKLPDEITNYLQSCKYLPRLNNELPNERNSTYKERFSSLQNLVLIMFENDTVLIPKETSWFGYYPDGAFNPVLPPQQTKLYTEDWIGLKILDEAEKVKYIKVPGAHVRLSENDMKQYVIPYLQDHPSVKNIKASDRKSKYQTSRKTKQSVEHVRDERVLTEVVLDGSSSYEWPPPVRSFFRDMLGISEKEQLSH